MLDTLRTAPIIAIIRSAQHLDLKAVVHSLFGGGVRFVEITLPTTGCLKAIDSLNREGLSGLQMGVGTVTNAEEAASAIDAGARFLVTPTLDLPTVQYAVDHGTPIFPGAYTPTEALTAWRAGATGIKLFPAEQLGPSFVKNLLAPLPELPLVPTGGVMLDNLPDWLDAGALAMGVGSSLVRRDLIEAQDWAGLTVWAREWIQRSTRC